MAYPRLMLTALTLSQARNALGRAVDTVGLDNPMRATLEEQFEFELWYEVHGEAPEAEEEDLELISS